MRTVVHKFGLCVGRLGVHARFSILAVLAPLAALCLSGCGGGTAVGPPPPPPPPHVITFSFGSEETVFTYSTDSCEPLDVPDTPAHAVRLADGSLVLADGDAPRNYAMFGADFATLRRSCTAPTLVSDDLTSPDRYDNTEWIHSVFRG